jgi:hypothetical protein
MQYGSKHLSPILKPTYVQGCCMAKKHVAPILKPTYLEGWMSSMTFQELSMYFTGLLSIYFSDQLEDMFVLANNGVLCSMANKQFQYGETFIFGHNTIILYLWEICTSHLKPT